MPWRATEVCTSSGCVARSKFEQRCCGSYWLIIWFGRPRCALSEASRADEGKTKAKGHPEAGSRRGLPPFASKRVVVRASDLNRLWIVARPPVGRPTPPRSGRGSRRQGTKNSQALRGQRSEVRGQRSDRCDL